MWNSEDTNHAIIVNGHSLVFALDPDFETLFLEVASQCKLIMNL